MQTTLNEYGRTFFALLNQMVRLEAKERMQTILDNSVSQNSGEEAEKMFKELQDQYDGPDKYIEQAKMLKEIRNV